VLCLVRAKEEEDERWVWAALGVGLTLWSFGDIWWITFYEDDPTVPYPSVADAFWLASYSPMAYGLWRLISVRVGWRALGAAAWLDGVIAALGGSAIFAATLLAGPLAAAAHGAPLTFATNLAYPIGDLILLGFALASLSATGWRPGRGIGLIAAGLLLRAMADFVYLDQITRGTYDGGLLDTAWPAASLLVAAAACVPASRSHREPDWRVFLAPTFFVTSSVGLLVYDHFDQIPTSAVLLAAVAVAAAAARMVTMVRVTVAASRQEAGTDPLTGLANRRMLKRDLYRALERAEAGEAYVFAIFDLNGFKAYNDTFGHPAGDALLVRLASALETAMAEHSGCAYRLGGDEFCVLARVEEGRSAPVVAAASQALTEHGGGFHITASYGAILLPEESQDVIEAMQLVDQRMYAQKTSGRRSPDRQSRDVLLRALQERNPELAERHAAVARLAEVIGERMDLAAEERAQLRQAAELHDVGKLAIPEEVLHKPSSLEPEEWVFVRRHPLIGERIIGAAPALAAAAKLVRSTHERLDGSGYPDGLAGDQIPLGARIIAVCDAFTAMTSPRPHAAQRTIGEAIAELRQCANTQFDPAVVDVLSELVVELVWPSEPSTAIASNLDPVRHRA
jgi:diguanylate cyclase (GGDEF)-like protein